MPFPGYPLAQDADPADPLNNPAHSTKHDDVAGAANDLQDQVDAHLADTTSVHGITDTSTLYRPGGADVAVADGGTGASTAATARTNLDVPSNAEAVLGSIIDAKGDLLAGTAADTIARVAVGANGQVLTADSAEAAGLKWAAPAVAVGGTIDRTETTVTVANTTTESDLYRFTVAGGFAAPGDRFVLDLAGDLLNDTGASVNFTFRFYIGATAVLATGNLSVADAAAGDRRALRTRIEIAVESTTAERILGQLVYSSPMITSWESLGASSTFRQGVKTVAVDLAAATDLALTVQMGTAAAAADCRALFAKLAHEPA